MGCGASAVRPGDGNSKVQAKTSDKAEEKKPKPKTSEGRAVLQRSSSRQLGPRQRSILDWQDPATLTLQENLVQNQEEEDIKQFYTMLDNDESLLGTGMSGSVRKITRNSDGKVFALKTIVTHNMAEEARQELQNEIQILKGLDHPHIGRLYETYEDPGVQIHLVLELCTGGELFDRLMTKKLFREGQTSEITFNMLRALHYIHCKNIVHRDLKLENWLFRTKDEDAEIVLIDFGLSAKFRQSDKDQEEHMHTRVGTSYYIAPEVLNGDYTSSCDMWSLGVVVYMLLSGTAPFGGSDDNQILTSVMKHEYSLSGPRWDDISDDAKNFIGKLLEPDPEKRYTAEQALVHPWVTKTASSHPVAEIDAGTYDNLRQFKQFHELKRIAMDVVAYSLDHSEIGELSSMFQDMDDDNNGFITFRELKKALAHIKGVSDKEIHEIFDAIDEDHTGMVHVNEFVAASLRAKDYLDEVHLRECFVKMDPLKTGFISVEGLKNLLGRCVDEQRVIAMVSEAALFPHSDGEHRIDFSAFSKFMQMDGTANVIKKTVGRVKELTPRQESETDTSKIEAEAGAVVKDIEAN